MPNTVRIIALLAVTSCVSVVPPGGTGGESGVPVAGGSRYKRGSEQPVRVALATNARDGRIGATGAWRLFDRSGGSDAPVSPASANEVWTVALRECAAAPCPVDITPAAGGQSRPIGGMVIARPESPGSVLTWNGKRYRGDLMISRTDTGLLVVNLLSMDSYLRGVVPLEIGNRTAAEFAAVQAQAVAARTYAYKHLSEERAFDLYATVQDQVYGGMDAEKPLADSAISTTRDIVVTYAGQPINTPYSSTCGGSTAAVSEVWYKQPDEPYLRPVSDRIPGTDRHYCDASPRFSWTYNYDAAALRAVMEKYLANYTNAPKSGLGRITGVVEQGRTQSDRVAALGIHTESGNYNLRGNDIRFVLRNPQGAILNSTYFRFTATTTGGEVTSMAITGRGFGHGIGMCQWGAIGRARAGQDYRTILQAYYQGTTVARIAG